MNRIFAVLATLVFLGLGACATSPLAGYSHAPLAQTALIGDEDCSPYTGVCKAGSNVNPQRLVRKLAYDTVTRYSVSCSMDVDEQVQNMLLSAGYQAGAYAVAEGGGTKLGVKFISKTVTGYGPYGAIVGGATGTIAGSITGAESAAGAKGDCVKQKTERVQGEFPEAIVVTVIAGKAFGANNHIHVASDNSAPR